MGSGGGIGSLLRWWIGRLVGNALSSGRFHYPHSLLIFLAHLLLVFKPLFCDRLDDRYGTFLQSAVLTGLLGGYTTFSSMQLDALKLTQTKQKLLALFYLLLSVLFGLAAALLVLG
ncbi:CrcB family protein [Providencia rettgeri]|uniref:Fluoride-specific ion channel n=1 Tax=Providencia rettgeri TaxID=587 RepID=A0A939NGZ0_PRORE|nr:CrcB family protein [Providencia rettgeri]